jgi:hypothetical protein
VRQANRLRGRQLKQERFVCVELELDHQKPPATAPASCQQLHRFSKIRLVEIQRNLTIGTAQHVNTISGRGATRNKLEN